MRKFWALILFTVIVSCKKESSDPLRFNQILILGNSITIHPPSPAIGWYGNWGMAASSKDKDFVHLIGTALGSRIDPVNLSEWEALGINYDLAKLNQYFTKQPDLIIIRLGENIRNHANLKQAFKNLIAYVKKQNPNAKLIITGRFWKNVEIENILSQCATEDHIAFVNLDQLEIGENVSFLGASIIGEDGLPHPVTDQGIANHPGDLGMRRIADCILAEIYKFR